MKKILVLLGGTGGGRAGRARGCWRQRPLLFTWWRRCGGGGGQGLKDVFLQFYGLNFDHSN